MWIRINEEYEGEIFLNLDKINFIKSVIWEADGLLRYVVVFDGDKSISFKTKNDYNKFLCDLEKILEVRNLI